LSSRVSITPSSTTTSSLINWNTTVAELIVYAVCACVDPNLCLPTITVHPSNKIVTEGESATFSVTTTGTGLTYQWQEKGPAPSDTYAPIPGETNSSYTTLPTVAADDNGARFHCVVTNAAGSVSSMEATLTVRPRQ
jgi:hypothetical protein